MRDLNNMKTILLVSLLGVSFASAPHIYIYIYTYIHIHIHIYIPRNPGGRNISRNANRQKFQPHANKDADNGESSRPKTKVAATGFLEQLFSRFIHRNKMLWFRML